MSSISMIKKIVFISTTSHLALLCSKGSRQLGIGRPAERYVFCIFKDDTKTNSPLNSSVKARSASYTNMLEKLVMEKELKFVAFAEEVK